MLVSAVIEQNIELVELLLRWGIDPKMKCDTGLSPIDYAKEQGAVACLQVMENKVNGIKLDSDVDNTRNKGENEAQEKAERKKALKEMNQDQLKTIVTTIYNEMKKEYIKPRIRIETLNEETNIYDSKFGGVPYLPKDFIYQYKIMKDQSKQPLKLLAQLNFEQMPHLEGFPKKGILQFYMACDGTYGLDNDEENDAQNSVRVVYHEHIVKNKKDLQEPPCINIQDDEDFPMSEGSLKLQFYLEEDVIALDDYIFEEIFVDKFNNSSPNKIKTIFELPSEAFDLLCEDAKRLHKVGGYAQFSKEKYEDYSIVLLQMDSEYLEEDDQDRPWIAFADDGMCNFLIRPSDLKKLDFSHVIYTWQCS